MLVAALILQSLQSDNPAAWGDEALQSIRREYYLPKSKLYAERPDKKQPAFNWGVGVMLSALNAAAKHDPKYKPWLREYADATRVYWNHGGYDVLPAPKPLDRYYDDNAWMALALAETYAVLGDRKYLDWAKGALDYALSGEAKEGGIYWREKDRASRNTCASAPTAAACLALSKPLKDPKLIEKARSLFDWTVRHLRDPSDGLFWDSLSEDGKIDKTKWTYNTALMIRTANGLNEKSSAMEMAAASKKRWLKDGLIADSGRFAHLLLEACLTNRSEDNKWIEAIKAVHEARSKEGFYPSHWSELKVAQNPELLDQASIARACFVLAGRSPSEGSGSKGTNL